MYGNTPEYSLIVLDRGSLPELSGRGAIEIEADQPNSCPIKGFPFLPFAQWFLAWWLNGIEIQVCGDSSLVINGRRAARTIANKPDRKPDIKPTPVFFPSFRRHTIGVK
jgi:hypothetical protein